MTEISLPITTLAAVCGGLILLLLTWQVIKLRRKDGVVLGDNDDRVLTKAIRGQANAAEQIPMAVVMLGLAELQGAPSMLLGVLAVTLIVGRGLHGIYFAVNGLTWRLRFYGMLMTLTAQLGLIITLLLTLIT